MAWLGFGNDKSVEIPSKESHLGSGSHKGPSMVKVQFPLESNSSERLPSKMSTLGSGFRQLLGQESQRLAPQCGLRLPRLQSADVWVCGH